MSKLIVGAVQMNSRDNKEENLARAETLIDEAAGRGAQLIVLPELFIFAGGARQQKENAEPIPGPSYQRLAAKARHHAIYLLAGSLPESVPGDERYYNTSVLFDPEGSQLASYRKIHLFDIELSSGTVIKESASVLAGTEIVTAETSFGTVGLTICYDLRFPELYRTLTFRGAKLILIPSSFMASTGKDHWEPLIRARAIENEVFIVAPNEMGTIPGTQMQRYGRSLIVDPWGTVLAQGGDVEGVVIATLDFGYLDKVRKELPCLVHHRPQLYR